MAQQRTRKEGKTGMNAATAEIDENSVTAEGENPGEGNDSSESPEEREARAKLPRELRPLYNEIYRLSSTLGMARKGCYASNVGAVIQSLERLQRQVPDALELANIVRDIETSAA